ncbi:MAG: HAD family hydrolase [Gammaproteobacteria bacterium]|nr:HAD family hydrolase [Gammaproteobacteria bacterium]
MALAIFDLDNTLLNGDSDYLWGQFLVELGVVDGDWYEGENQRFYDEYKTGRLDIFEFLCFSLKPLAEHDMATLNDWHARFMEEKIRPIIQTKAQALVDRHREAGDTLLIITATNRFVTAPISAVFGIDNLLATDPAQEHGQYTGEVAGTPCFRDGKVERLNNWLRETGFNLEGSYFYSDSHNDLPLLEKVQHPVVVDADDTLRQHAEQVGWDIISLRD